MDRKEDRLYKHVDGHGKHVDRHDRQMDRQERWTDKGEWKNRQAGRQMDG